MTRPAYLRPLASGILGITLMLPGFLFVLTLLARLCFGARSMYYYVAPSFLQSPFDLFAFHKAQLIIGSLLLAAGFNAWAVHRSRHWLNTAVALQSTMLLLLLLVYTFIQHLRY